MMHTFAPVDDEVDIAAAESGLMPLPSSLLSSYRHRVETVLGEATLPVPPDPWWQLLC